MEADYMTSELLEDAHDDAAWIFETYHEDGDDKTPSHSNYVRKRLRMMAKRHRYMAQLLRGERDDT